MRVVIAEDSVLLREGLVRLLADEGIEVVQAVGDGEALLAAAERQQPDLAIVDVRMPPTHTDEGLRAAIEARARVPEMAILVLSQYVEERYASDLLAAGGAGIGYLLKERVADVGEFVESVRRVAEGGTAFDPEVVAQLMGRRRRDDPLSELTPREREVLSLMAEGLSNSAIAKRLWLTVGAVEKHIGSIFGRLGLLPGDDENRRVRAVLTYLEGTRGS
jgi:DNA-binding NarL/FixJ family response regulator